MSVGQHAGRWPLDAAGGRRRASAERCRSRSPSLRSRAARVSRHCPPPCPAPPQVFWRWWCLRSPPTPRIPVRPPRNSCTPTPKYL